MTEKKNWWWVTEDTQAFMKDYLNKDETVEERVTAIATDAAEILRKGGYSDHASFRDKFIDYMARGFYSLASPVWSNFGRSGLPISCNNVFVEDTMESILTKVSEVGMQTKHGAGTSAYLGALRERGAAINTGGTAFGPVHFASLFEATSDVVSQGSVRRGSCAIYLDVHHPDVLEFLDIRENGSPIQNLSIGLCLPDWWMDQMVMGDPEKRAIWARILRKRYESGYPYLIFSGAVARGRPQVYKDKDMTVFSSNLCTEIFLPSTVDESFVCDLSSLNMVMIDEIMSTDAVEVLVTFLDAVMTDYINKTEGIKYLESARRFAQRHRALGVGVLGWHTYLQSRRIPFESIKAVDETRRIFNYIKTHGELQSALLARELGEPEVLAGYGRRNTTLFAIAPTTSSSFILGQVSKGVEPIVDNYHTKNLAKGKFSYRNPILREVLAEHGRDSEEVWRSILDRGGSVQHLDFLSDNERDVFKTFGEIAQIAVVNQAAVRQEYIDQGQSVNLMIHPEVPPRDTSQLLITAWQLGLKSLYYQMSTNKAQQLMRNLLECESCSA